MDKVIRIRRIVIVTAVFLACADGTALAGTDTVTFSTPGEQHIVIPTGVSTLHVIAVGGSGGQGAFLVDGGFGADVTGDLAVIAGSSRYLEVGGNGTSGENYGGGGGGGGASDVRTLPASSGVAPTDPRVLIAGGGGGSGRGFGIGANGSAGIGGNGGMPGGDSRQECGGCTFVSGGGHAGVPAGTGAGGQSGDPGNPGEGEAGAAGTLGFGGAGAFIDDQVQTPAPGGYNGGAVGGGYTNVVFGNTFILFGGGGGGGGLNGGGGGGGVAAGASGNSASGGGGGGGGSNLVPPGGSASTDTTGSGSITVSFADSTAPVVSLSAPPARVGASLTLAGTSGTVLGDGAVTINVYAGPSATGVPVDSFTADRNATTGAYSGSPAPGLPDGQYTAQATQADGAGNIGTSAARTFVYDTTAPNLSLTAPANGLVTADPTPQFTGVAETAAGDSATVSVSVYTDTLALVQTVSGQRDGATGAFSFPASPALPDGTYLASASESDDVGNTGMSDTVTFRVDTHPPGPTLTTPAAARTAAATPSFTGNGGTADGDAGSVVVHVYHGSAPSGTAVETLQAGLDGDGHYHVNATQPLPDGTYTAQTSQGDSAGNTGTSASRTFTVDTAPPKVTLVTPASGAVVPSVPSFAGVGGTATGDDATVTVKVYAGGAAAGTVVQTLAATRDAATGAYSSVSPFALADGTYTAQATQVDDVGNAGASPTRTFTVSIGSGTGPGGSGGVPDRTPPVLSGVSVSNRRFRIGSSRPSVTAPARARRLPIGTIVRYQLSEKATVTFAITRQGHARAAGTLTRHDAAGSHRVRFTGRIGRKGLVSGHYVMTIRAVDTAGNRSQPRRLSFQIG
jgi:Bacterial Ig-like domain